MNEIELKPCPFCGSDDVVFGAGLEDEYYVECWDCSAKVESCFGKTTRSISAMFAKSAATKWTLETCVAGRAGGSNVVGR